MNPIDFVTMFGAIWIGSKNPDGLKAFLLHSAALRMLPYRE